MEVGTPVWFRNDDYSRPGDQAWLPTTIQTKRKTPDGSSITYYVSHPKGKPEGYRSIAAQKETEALKLRNVLPDDVDIENLIDLPYLNEPELLHHLGKRFQTNKIYTYTGPILIAIKPPRSIDFNYAPHPHRSESNVAAGDRRDDDERNAGRENMLHNFSMNIKRVCIDKNSSKISGDRERMHTADGGRTLPRHTFASASEFLPSDECFSPTQSILISGESGSGKTECSKLLLSYLAEAATGNMYKEISSNSSNVNDSESSVVMQSLLNANVVLEAFGNAKTLRNQNGSRFGKYLQCTFDGDGVLCGGNITTYLLELLRIPSQRPQERNFHIFYQLLAGASDEERVVWQLGRRMPSQQQQGVRVEELTSSAYRYLSSGQCSVVAGIDDAAQFQKLKAALAALQFDKSEVRLVFEVVAGLVHLGQISFVSADIQDTEGCIVTAESRPSLTQAAYTLGFSEAALEAALTRRNVSVVSLSHEETVQKLLTADQALKVCDAIAKSAYKNLVDWLVDQINSRIRVGGNHRSAKNRSAAVGATRQELQFHVNILDVFGFENAENNSLEQLCINYTNEALQQQFSQEVFKKEISLYDAEKLVYDRIVYPDNQDSLDLIGSALFKILDDQCRLPSPTDKKVAGVLYRELEGHPRFAGSAMLQSSAQFGVKHFAGDVVYATDGFVAKNSDELPTDAHRLLASSSNVILCGRDGSEDGSGGERVGNEEGQGGLAAAAALTTRRGSVLEGGGRGGGGGERVGNASKQSGVSLFKAQLSVLIREVNNTQPHYIRCIKPSDNDDNDMVGGGGISSRIDPFRVAEQLKYSGIVEVIQISRSGFPVRFSYADFYARYRNIANPFNIVLDTLPLYLQRGAGGEDGADIKMHCEQLAQVLCADPRNVNITAASAAVLSGGRYDPAIDDSNYNNDNNGPVYTRLADVDFGWIASNIGWIVGLTKNSILSPGSVQIGQTRVFIRKIEHEILERCRTKLRHATALKIQNAFREYKRRFWIARFESSILTIQRISRGFLGRLRFKSVQQGIVMTKIQKHVRRWLITANMPKTRRRLLLAKKAAAKSDQLSLQKRVVQLFTNYANLSHEKSWEDMAENVFVIREIILATKRLPSKGNKLDYSVSLDRKLVNPFIELLLTNAGLAEIGADLAAKGAFTQEESVKIAHSLANSRIMDRYITVIRNLVLFRPEIVFFRDKSDGCMLCDKIRRIPDSRSRSKGKYRLLLEVVHAAGSPGGIASLEFSKPGVAAVAGSLSSNNHNNSNSSGTCARERGVRGAADKGMSIGTGMGMRMLGVGGVMPGMSGMLTSSSITISDIHLSHDIFSGYRGEEELILRASSYGFKISMQELQTKQFDFSKRLSDGSNILHQTIARHKEASKNPFFIAPGSLTIPALPIFSPSAVSTVGTGDATGAGVGVAPGVFMSGERKKPFELVAEALKERLAMGDLTNEALYRMIWEERQLVAGKAMTAWALALVCDAQDVIEVLATFEGAIDFGRKQQSLRTLSADFAADSAAAVADSAAAAATNNPTTTEAALAGEDAGCVRARGSDADSLPADIERVKANLMQSRLASKRIVFAVSRAESAMEQLVDSVAAVGEAQGEGGGGRGGVSRARAVRGRRSVGRTSENAGGERESLSKSRGSSSSVRFLFHESGSIGVNTAAQNMQLSSRTLSKKAGLRISTDAAASEEEEERKDVSKRAVQRESGGRGVAEGKAGWREEDEAVRDSAARGGRISPQGGASAMPLL